MAMMKKLTSALVTSSLVLGLVGTAGATTPDKIDTAASRMATLGLVQGKGGSDLSLGDSITRAELVTVIVRAFGQEASAKYLAGVKAFPDVNDHWASGYIAMADQLIKARSNGTEVVGYPDGTFKPDGQVTTAEAIAFLMKFTGAPKDNSLPYPDNYLQGAVNAGLITTEDLANIEAVKNAPATRGLAFYLADSAFAGYKLNTGSTVYRTFVDKTGPTLNITTQAPAEPTLNSKITISGTVSGAESVFVGTPDNKAAIDNGTFSIDVDLAMGENNITVTAVDLVGNTTEQTLKVTRTAGVADSIKAEDVTVVAGETVDVAASVVDAAGNVLEGAAITGQSESGAYADGKFTAGTTAGKGTLTLTSGDLSTTVNVTITPAELASVKAANSFAVGEAVKLVGVDAYGNVVDGVTFSKSSSDIYLDGDQLLVTKEGSYTITGTLGDRVVTGTVSAYGEVSGMIVEADKENLVANGESTVTVTVKAVDANGNFVPDFDGYARYDGYLVVSDEDDYLYTEDEGEAAVVEMKDGVATFTLLADDTNLADEDVELEFALYEEYADATGRANDPADPVAEDELTLAVVEQEATAFSLDAPDYLAVNTDGSAKVTIKVLDQDGEEMLDSDDYDFTVEVDGPAHLLDEDDDEVDSLDFDDEDIDAEDGRTIYVYADDDDETGTVTVTVSSKNLKSATATIKAAIAGRARGIQIDSDDDSVEVTETDAVEDGAFANVGAYDVQLVDKKGVPTSNDGKDKVTVNVDNAAYVGAIYVKNADVDNDGTIEEDWTQLLTDSFTVLPAQDTGKATFQLATEKAQTIKLSAEDEDDDDAVDLSDSNIFEVVFEAGKPSQIALVGFEGSSKSTMILEPEKEATLVAQLYDHYGNPVNKAGYAVSIESISSNAKGRSYVEVNGETDSKDIEDLDLTTDRNGQIVLDVELDDDAPANTEMVLKDGITEAEHTIALTGANDVADELDVVVTQNIGDTQNPNYKRVPAVTSGNTYYLELTGEDDDNDALKDFGVVRITSSAAVHWGEDSSASLKAVNVDTQSAADGKAYVAFTVPDGLDVSRITFKVELVSFNKVVSDTVSVKLAD